MVFIEMEITLCSLSRSLASLEKDSAEPASIEKKCFLVCSKIEDDSLRQIRPTAEVAHTTSPFGHVHSEGWLVAGGLWKVTL